jgi:hypothetical protein
MEYFLFLLRNYSNKADKKEKKGEKECFFNLDESSFTPSLKDFLAYLLKSDCAKRPHSWKSLWDHPYLSGREEKKEIEEVQRGNEKSEEEACSSLVVFGLFP